METLQGFDFFPLNFDSDGVLQSPDVWKEFLERVGSQAATDAIFIAHGFRNDANEARDLYGEFLQTFRKNMSRPELQSLQSRRFVVAGIFWPSKSFRESFGRDEGGVQGLDQGSSELEGARQQLEDLKNADLSPEQKKKLDQAAALLPTLDASRDNQDRFVELVLSIVDDKQLDTTEGLDKVKSQAGSELLDKLTVPIVLPTEESQDEGGVEALQSPLTVGGTDEGSAEGIVTVASSVFGRVGQFLNLTTWYLMKNRSGTVGANGVAHCVRDLRKQFASTEVHLVGHSLGGRLVTSCAKSLAQPPVVKVNSLILLQAAFSQFGLSADNRAGVAGFFRDVIDKQVDTGPMVATFSFQDEVVGKAYAIASRLAGDNVKAIGDANDPYGGIGRNGAQNLKEFDKDKLHLAGASYTFPARILHCLDGSGGLIRNHGDIRNENVTYAAASAIAQA